MKKSKEEDRRNAIFSLVFLAKENGIIWHDDPFEPRACSRNANQEFAQSIIFVITTLHKTVKIVIWH